MIRLKYISLFLYMLIIISLQTSIHAVSGGIDDQSLILQQECNDISKEYQFDILFEPEYEMSRNRFRTDSQNVYVEEECVDTPKVIVYNHKFEKIDEYNKTRETVTIRDYEIAEIIQRQMKKKYGYECMSEFKNGFSFVREQSLNGIPLGYKVSVHYDDEYGSFFPEDFSRETIEKIAAEYRHGYKFINEDGDVIFDNLEADISVKDHIGGGNDGASYSYILFNPSYFNEFGIAAVKQNGKFGIIDTQGNIICDFIYDRITICNENTAIINLGNIEKFYYINLGQESDFQAYQIYYLKDDYFYFHNFTFFPYSKECGIIDSNGNIMLPDSGVNILEGYNAISYYYYAGPEESIYYNKDFEVVCFCSNRGTFDKTGKLIWSDYTIEPYYELFGNLFVLYKFQNSTAFRALAAINRIPKPPFNTCSNFISIMVNNPLVNVDGHTRTIKDHNYFFTPVISNGYMLLPLELLEELNMLTRWDEKSKTIEVAIGEKKMGLKIDSNEAHLNGDIVQLDALAQIVDGCVLVPFEIVATALGANKHWDEKSETLSLFYD